MRACPAGSPVKAHAPVCVSGFQHPALAAPREEHRGDAGVVASHPNGGRHG